MKRFTGVFFVAGLFSAVMGCRGLDFWTGSNHEAVAITMFLASSPLVSPGDTVTLRWVTRKAAACEINPGSIAAQPGSTASTVVTVNATTTFILTCRGPGGPVNSTPVTVQVTDSDWATVSAGAQNTCALKSDGRLFCWGAGEYGGLGNNAALSSLVPVQEYTGTTDWAQVSTGSGHTCAVKKDGRLFCWGSNDYGQLGNNSTSYSLVPVQESTSATDWAQLSSGSYHTCAIKKDGRLFCWGGSILGNNSGSGSPVPVQEATAATDWAQVSAGSSHTCALKTDGRLFCWGKGDELGNGSDSDSLVPVQESTAATDWVQVSSGSSHTCALKTDGRLFCWGSGEYGQLGNTSTLYSLVPVQESTAATDWVQVSSGSSHTCALKTDGRLFCWGSGEYGQLGNNFYSDSPMPVQEATVATDWAQVSLGMFHTCAVKHDGRIFCWGSEAQGALGNLFSPGNLVMLQEATFATDWAQVSAGGGHTCAVKDGGRLFCWGIGFFGRLGNNATSSSPVPVQEATAATDWAQVSAGVRHTCAVKKNGRLFCWGSNEWGKLGNGSYSDSLVPVQEYTAATDWMQFSSGFEHTCAVKKDGRLFCWGSNEWGKLGNESYSDSPIPVQERTAAADWAQVSAGGFHTCAVKKDGRLFCWGFPGGDEPDPFSDLNSLPVQESTAATDWAQVSSGSFHTCAIKKDGRLFCWGDGEFGQLGNNSTSNGWITVPVQEYTAATDWVQVSAGTYQTCAVKKDGRLFCWGFSTPDGLGNNSNLNTLVPMQEKLAATDWAQVSSGSTHTCALTNHGWLLCSGFNIIGELGRPNFGPIWPTD